MKNQIAILKPKMYSCVEHKGTKYLYYKGGEEKLTYSENLVDGIVFNMNEHSILSFIELVSKILHSSIMMMSMRFASKLTKFDFLRNFIGNSAYFLFTSNLR